MPSIQGIIHTSGIASHLRPTGHQPAVPARPELARGANTGQGDNMLKIQYKEYDQKILGAELGDTEEHHEYDGAGLDQEYDGAGLEEGDGYREVVASSGDGPQWAVRGGLGIFHIVGVRVPKGLLTYWVSGIQKVLAKIFII